LVGLAAELFDLISKLDFEHFLDQTLVLDKDFGFPV
jgi:hypothetical protein